MIVTACEAFGLTASETKTKILFLRTKATKPVPFIVLAADHMYVQTHCRVCVLGTGNIFANRGLRSVEIVIVHQRAWAWLRGGKYENLPTFRLCTYA